MRIAMMRMVLTASLLASGCAMTVDGAEEAPGAVEAVGEVSQAWVSLAGHGWAYVLGTGALTRAYNSEVAGSGVASERLGVGQYLVAFEDIPASRATAQVVANGAGNSHCKLALQGLSSAGRLEWYVLCHDPEGDVADSDFTLITDNRSGTSSIDEGAYLTSSLTGTVTNAWNSSGGTNTVSHNAATHAYTASLPGMTSSNAAVHVTAVGFDDRRCKVVSWNLGTVNIKCFDSSGAAVDSRFMLTYQNTSLLSDTFDNNAGGHAWVSSGTVPSSYTNTEGADLCWPDLGFGVSASGLDLIVTMSNAATSFGSSADLVPMVTGYGLNSTHCKVVSWNVSNRVVTYTVRCWANSGTQVNASSYAFTTSVTNYAAPDFYCF